MITHYTQHLISTDWVRRYQGKKPIFACVLGFTHTGLIQGISTAGARPSDRQLTAIADAEFLVNGITRPPQFPLPPLIMGASPVFISRAIVEACTISTHVFNAGLPQAPSVPAIDLDGVAARCLTSGQAMSQETVDHLFRQGLVWGEKLATAAKKSYLLIGECVVGGTTTALALLTALGIEARDKVNSSHPNCNHQQKWSVVSTGLEAARRLNPEENDPLSWVAAVGDPMQIVVAGMAIAASSTVGVLLAGGTQMLAVYALIQAIVAQRSLAHRLDQIIVGTTRWVAEDPTGDTLGLAKNIGQVPLIATQLDFSWSQHSLLRAYEQGFIKEGVGAGGCAIAAHLMQRWTNLHLVSLIDQLLAEYQAKNGLSNSANR